LRAGTIKISVVTSTAAAGGTWIVVQHTPIVVEDDDGSTGPRVDERQQLE